VSVYDQSAEKEGSLENPLVGLTGWVVNPELSQGDVWFVHPFGFDFEYYIVPDPQYEGLLGASNTSVTPGTGAQDSDYVAANNAAHDIGLDAPKGVLGVETDQGLMPPPFRSLITNGARIATFGRWIVDCGHDDFHTEIHAPLLMAVATPSPPPRGVRGASQMTSLRIMSRPYTVSQKFAEGNSTAEYRPTSMTRRAHRVPSTIRTSPRRSAWISFNPGPGCRRTTASRSRFTAG